MREGAVGGMRRSIIRNLVLAVFLEKARNIGVYFLSGFLAKHVFQWLDILHRSWRPREAASLADARVREHTNTSICNLSLMSSRWCL